MIGHWRRTCLTLFAVFTALTLAGTFEAARAVPTENIPKLAQGHWRTQIAAVNTAGVVDSLARTLNALTPDTTQAISTADLDWGGYGLGQSGTGMGLMRIWIRSTTPTSAKGDSVYFSVDGSPDGKVWPLNGDIGVATATTGILSLTGTAGDSTLTGLVIFDADQQGTTGTTNAWLSPYIRFRFRAQNSCKLAWARFFYAYQKLRLSQ